MSKLQIGEVSRRTGVSTAALRAWETRYGLLRPERSSGGTRLYSLADVARVTAMQEHIASGLSAAQAAVAVLEELSKEPGAPVSSAAETPQPAPLPAPAPRSSEPAVHLAADAEPDLEVVAGSEVAAAALDLREAMIALDRDRAEAVLDALLAWLPFESLLDTILLPYLQDVGQRWAAGEASIAEEHLATNVMRGRLLALARSTSRGDTRPVVLACPPEERHDLPLVMLMVLLRRRGLSCVLLGADTPLESVAEAARAVASTAIVLSAMDPERFGLHGAELRELAATWPVLIAGPGATPQVAAALGVRQLGDLRTAARTVQMAAAGG